MGKRHRKSTPAQPASQSPAVPPIPPPFWTAGKLLIMVSGWICSVLLGILDLPAKIVSFAANKDAALEHTGTLLWGYERYEGRWTSDESAWVGKHLIVSGDTVPDHGDVQLIINHQGNGVFSGEIVTRSLAENFAPWSRVNIDGTVGFGGFRGEVWDVVHGERQVYTRFRLKPYDGNADALRLITDQRGALLFPGDLTLWRTDAEMNPGQQGARFNETFHRWMERGMKVDGGEHNVARGRH